MYYVVRYSGPFGFIKPWTAVRDAGGGGETFSQQFLTPSIIEGIRQKLDVANIVRHKLSYASVSVQQEVIKAKAWKQNRKVYTRESSVLKRGILINPILYLAFDTMGDAKKAAEQHICLCRNEDVLLPTQTITEITESEFNNINGYELRFEKNEKSFLVGYNRFENNEEMFGWIDIVGNPSQISSYE